MNTKATKKLKVLKKELNKRIKDVKTSLTSKRNQDWAEAAVEAENDEVLEGIFTEASEELQQVEFALQRIKDGDYSVCSECNEAINKKRLKIMPYTSLCIKCAQKLEYASMN
jgi:RNA polymerase-binding transcription factor DksA